MARARFNRTTEPALNGLPVLALNHARQHPAISSRNPPFTHATFIMRGARWEVNPAPGQKITIGKAQVLEEGRTGLFRTKMKPEFDAGFPFVAHAV
ncbi:MAG: hypothetical protein ACXIUM_11720 [Wenzhouxiangella sp.]